MCSRAPGLVASEEGQANTVTTISSIRRGPRHAVNDRRKWIILDFLIRLRLIGSRYPDALDALMRAHALRDGATAKQLDRFAAVDEFVRLKQYEK